VEKLLFVLQEDSLLDKKPCHHGPIDLDESVTDSCSDMSSLYGSASWAKRTKTQLKNDITKTEADLPESTAQIDNLPNVASPLNYDDDDHTPFEDVEDIFEKRDEPSLRYNWSYFDEAVLSQTFQETMDSISVSRILELNRNRESGSLLLTEDELNRHEKSTKFHLSFPSSTIQGYDIWKRKQEEKQRYFAKIHEKAMERKYERELLDRRQPSQTTISRSVRRVDSTSDKSIVDTSINSTIQTIAPHQALPRRSTERRPPDNRRGWNVFSGVLHKKHGNAAGSSENTRGKGSTSPKKKNKKKREPAVVSLETFMRISNDEPEDVADVSLAPLNKLGPITLPSSVPTGTTYDATSSHNLHPMEGGPRKLALEHLERERQKNIQAENEKDKLEKREQRRISMLKERELERQRQMNSLAQVAKAASHLSNEAPSTVISNKSNGISSGILESTLSFESTNTVKSSLQSPTSVINLSPCILCNARERSHVAVPCMHFYFCESCAGDMTSNPSPVVCPICQTKNISFARVFT
jgi:rubrerythrin